LFFSCCDRYFFPGVHEGPHETVGLDLWYRLSFGASHDENEEMVGEAIGDDLARNGEEVAAERDRVLAALLDPSGPTASLIDYVGLESQQVRLLGGANLGHHHHGIADSDARTQHRALVAGKANGAAGGSYLPNDLWVAHQQLPHFSLARPPEAWARTGGDSRIVVQVGGFSGSKLSTVPLVFLCRIESTPLPPFCFLWCEMTR
jgi:hypothetical protein